MHIFMKKIIEFNCIILCVIKICLLILKPTMILETLCITANNQFSIVWKAVRFEYPLRTKSSYVPNLGWGDHTCSQCWFENPLIFFRYYKCFLFLSKYFVKPFNLTRNRVSLIFKLEPFFFIFDIVTHKIHRINNFSKLFVVKNYCLWNFI